MAEYMRSYMRRWRRTNAQVAAIIESNEDVDEIPNQLGDGENPVRNELDEENYIERFRRHLTYR